MGKIVTFGLISYIMGLVTAVNPNLAKMLLMG